MTVLTTTAPTIDATGIHAPSYVDVLDTIQAAYRGIYGEDVYLGNDSQDGQFIAIIASAINDSNAAAVAVYNSFSPTTAQGNGLSSTVKINGLARLLPSASTVDVVIIGVAGTTISNGIVADADNNQFNLPASVVIPVAGTITVTATSAVLGAFTALPNTVNQIKTPTLGWQSANNPNSGAPGSPVESDATLRQRQAVSTALPSLTVLDGIVGAVASVTGVTRYAGYENDTGIPDSNGIPGHSISLVVEGGDSTEIATAIARKKTPGVGTYGNVTQTIQDGNITSIDVSFYRPTIVTITVAITLQALSGYSSKVGDEIKAAVSAYISGLAIGQDVYLSRLYTPANLSGTADGLTYDITQILIAASPGTPAAADVPIAFNAAALCGVGNITVTVV